ncbi:MAG: hypothetical protein WC867_05855 [Candidatus Pacearchaeota archaeon]|jgi:tetratricopeptide (TPR) repeat protein
MNLLLVSSIERSQIYRASFEIDEIRSNNDFISIKEYLPSVIDNASKKGTTLNGLTLLEHLAIIDDKNPENPFNTDPQYKRNIIQLSLEELLFKLGPSEIEKFSMEEYASNPSHAAILNYCLTLAYEELSNEVFRRREEGILSFSEKLNLEGTHAFKEKNYDKSLILFNDSIKASSEFPLPHVNKAILYRTIGDLNSSIESVNKAIEIYPRNKYAHFQLAKNLYQKGDNENALDYLRNVFFLDLDFGPAFELFKEIKPDFLSH